MKDGSLNLNPKINDRTHEIRICLNKNDRYQFLLLSKRIYLPVIQYQLDLYFLNSIHLFTYQGYH